MQTKLCVFHLSVISCHSCPFFFFFPPLESHDWLGCWGHHMKSPGFKAIREFQKVRLGAWSVCVLLLCNKNPSIWYLIFDDLENYLSSCWSYFNTFHNCLILPVSRVLTRVHFCLAAEPLSRLLSDRPEGQTLEEPVQDAGTLWQKRIWLLPTLLHSPTGYQAAAEGLGWWRQQAEVDRQTGTITIIKLLRNYSLKFLSLTCCRFSLSASVCSRNWHSGHSQVEPDATQETAAGAEVSWKTLHHISLIREVS